MSLLSNAKWNALSQIFKISLQLLSLVYLAKIIPPNEYGLMAMAAVFVNLGILLRDLGTSAALIQQRVITEELKNTIFWLNLILGFIILIALCSVAGFISRIYNQPKLEYVFYLLSLTFPLSSCVSAHLALLERDSKFKVISFVEVFSSLFSVVIAIILARKGFGVYSLVVQAISLNLISAIFFWYISKWRPSLKLFINKEELRRIFSFSANLSIFNFINYFARSGDSFIIGRYMSASILGSYNLAYRIMLFPLQSLSFVASRSLYPILSNAQDDNRLIYRTYCDCVFVIVLITAPLMTGIAIFSTPIINIFFGEQWSVTSQVLKLLAPTAIIQSILSTTGSVFTAKGRTDVLMKLGILGTILQFGSFLIGVNYNIQVFALCYLVANILNFFPVMIVLMNVISGSFYKFIFNLFPVFLSTIIMFFILRIVDFYFYKLDEVRDFFMLLVIGCGGALIYFIVLYFFSKKFRSFFSINLR